MTASTTKTRTEASRRKEDEKQADQHGILYILGNALKAIDEHLDAHGTDDSFGEDLNVLRGVLATYRQLLDSVTV